MAWRRFFLWVLLIVSNISPSAPFASPSLPSVTITTATASGQYTLRGESGAVLGLDVHAAVMSQRGLGVGTRSRAGRGEAACGLRCVSSTSPSLSSHGLGRKPTSTLVAMQPCSGRYGSRAVQRAGWVGLFAKKKGGDGEKKLSKEKLDELRRKEELKEARRREEMESRAAAMRKTPLKPASVEPVAANRGASPRKEPLRVSSQHLMSVKTQIRLLKHIQAAEKKSTQTVHRTKFRRAKDDAPDEEEVKPSTSGGDLWSGLKEPPLFLVDGYNIIGLWPKLKKKKNQDDMDGARMLLQQELMQFASYRGCTVELVYDAVGGRDSIGGPSTDAITDDLTVVWVRDRSADSYLEGRAIDMQKENPDMQTWVCTNDRAILDMARSHGAYTMSSNLLVQEIKRATKETEGSLLDPNAFSLKGGMMEDRISVEAADLLNNMIFEQHYGKGKANDARGEPKEEGK